MEDQELLREYAERHSDQAFTELVERHINLVYSTALRFMQEPQAAEDVAQKVFLLLARKPGAIRNAQALAGWLYRTTRFTAAASLRAEHRRRERENAAVQLNTLEPDAPSLWRALTRHLDDAMDTLDGVEQDAVALRFFEGKNLREVGRALGISEDAAHKRVSRALEKLRSHFARRGITATAGVLAAALGIPAAQSAPAGLSISIASDSLAGASGATAILKGILMAKTQTALVAALVLAAVTTPTIMQHRANVRLRNEVTALKWEKAALLEQQGQQKPGSTNGAAGLVVAAARKADAPNHSVEELVAETAAAFEAARSKGEDKWGVMTKWMGFLSQVPRDQFDRALLATLKLPSGEARSGIALVLFHNWALNNPRAALAFATVNFRGQELSRSVTEALMNWAKQEPEAAFASWQEQSADPTKRAAWGGSNEELVKALFEGMAQQDFQKAARLLQNLDREHLGNALAGLASAAAKTEPGRASFLQQLEGVTDPAIKTRATQQFMAAWANQGDLQSAIAWVESLPAEQRGLYAGEVGSAYARANPKAAADWWLAQLTNERDRSDAIFTIAQEWAPEDAGAAGEWLNRQGTGPETDGGRYAYAEQVLYHDPETAIKWAQSISGSDYRNECLVHIWQEWRKRDSAAAEQFLNRSGWPAELTARAKAGVAAN